MSAFLEKVKQTMFKTNTPLPSDRDVIIQLISDEMKKLSNKVDYRFKKLESSQIKVSKIFLKLGENIMAELKDVQDAIAAEKAEVAAKLAELATVIESLEAELANGTPVTGDDLAALVAQVQGIYAEPVLTPVEPLPAE